MRTRTPHWILAGFVAVASHMALLIRSPASLYGDVSPPAGPMIESAVSLAGIIGAAVEVEAVDALTEVTAQDPAQVVEQTSTQATAEAQEAPAAMLDVPVMEAMEPLAVVIQNRQNAEAPAHAKPRAQNTPKKTKSEAKPPPDSRKRKKDASKPKSASKRSVAGNANTGSAGASSGGKGGRTTASAGAINAYAAKVRARILSRRPSGGGVKGTTVISFGVTSGGGLRFASVSRSSGNKALDGRALAAVRGTSFPPPPPGTPAGRLNFSIPFHFR